MVDAEPGCAAPGKATCSFLVFETEDGKDLPTADAPVDPDDALGWLRYLR